MDVSYAYHNIILYRIRIVFGAMVWLRMMADIYANANKHTDTCYIHILLIYLLSGKKFKHIFLFV